MPSGQRTLVISGGIDPILSQLRTDTPIEIVSAVIPVSARSAVDFGFVGNLEIGETASVGADGAIAIGGRGVPTASGVDSIAIGSGTASPNDGPLATASRAIAIGTGATADGLRSICIGNIATANAPATSGIAIGEAASVGGGNAGSIAIGLNAQVGGNGGSISIGRDSITGSDTDNVAIGRAASAQGTRCVAIGQGASVSIGNIGANAIGDGATVTEAGGVTHISSVQLFLGRVGSGNRFRVLRTRITGWGAPTGTATRTAFDTATVTLAQLAERVKALLDDLGMVDSTGHGLIGA